MFWEEKDRAERLFMKDRHYSFNNRTLKYEPVRKGSLCNIIKLLGFLGGSIALAVPMVLLLIPFLNSIKEKSLADVRGGLIRKFDLANKDLDVLSSNLATIQFRDDYIYRPLVNKEPVDSTIRLAGFGGVDHYSELVNIPNTELIVSTLQRIDQLSKQVFVQSKSYEDVLRLAFERETKLHSVPAIQPVSNTDLSYISSSFGYRSDPISHIKTFHSGVDFCAPIGVKVYSTGDGVVRKVQKLARGYGKHIIIDHGFGYETVYGHLSKFNVIEGQKVKRGEVIGFVGSTGKSTGPHLHYEVRVGGRAVNPKSYYQQDLSPPEFELVLRTSTNS